ncbi:PTS sugar transporter subunit IIB [Miniphocaeibacter halophilus]|uniref:PTS sugar transporter subunit IIB n=1 Tax=Miniphocaeibacter halophilus TaxID=2931922 RepID=A0AC61MZH6_9FIRM|nr:PTS sugar transporter subunit IIB [Miniphocaeibacter halophilus]QQK08373.1 PTS sugar transporter subunit IIB [Miniphocaeibacter halophilus]
MLNILLVCSAGMSTSMLVQRMQEEADGRGLEAKISAVGSAEIDSASKDADVILLGPQVRYQLKSIQGVVNNEKPVTVISSNIYGLMDGKKALDLAISEIENFNK